MAILGIPDEKLILYGAVGVGGYFLLQKLGKIINPTTTNQTAEIFNAMHYDSYTAGDYAYLSDDANPQTSLDTSAPLDILFKTPGTMFLSKLFPDKYTNTYRFGKGDYDKLNFAQKFLLTTHIVPVNWVLGGY
jgi:hypothetical protein